MGWSEIKGWYYGKSKLEKVLLCCISFLVVIIIVLFVCLLTSHDNEVCTTTECIRASVHLLDSVDPDADPCEDFYAFACGNFVKNAYSNGHPTSLYALNQLAMNQLKQIVIEDRNNSDLPRTVMFQRKFYKACMDTKEIEDHGEERMFNLLDEVVGGWPILKMANWQEANYDWKKPMIAARKLGLFHMFFISVELYHNYTKNYTSVKSFLWLRPPSSTDIESFHFNDTSVEFIHNIAKELGADSVDVKQELRITNTFVEHLRVIAKKHEKKIQEQNNDQKTKISIKDINHKLMKIDWLNFLRNMTGIHLNGKEKVVFDVEDYLTDLYYLFHRTHKKIQANYVAWILLSTNINYLPEKIRDNYNEILMNDENKSSRKDQCYKLSTGLFRMIAESEYIRRYTTPAKKHEIQSMIDYIKAEMKDAIETTQWIDIESRSNALKRLANVTTYIGWLDVAFNVTKLEELTGFNKVKHFPEHGAAIDMAMVALKTKYDKFYTQIIHKINELETLTNPKVEINAYYMYKYNVLILPAPILQGIIFDLQRPHYMNFGALGSVIGHELTHGFSILYERNEDDDQMLWTNGTLEKRGEIVECIKNSYDDFSIEQGSLPDNSTSTEENIADFNGVNLAYNAYRNWIRDHGGEPALPGIKYTPNQIFWIMASTYMCYEPELADKDSVIGKDKYHGAPKFRVLGRIINSPYFAYDFNCPEGSKMNPKEKCRIFL